MPSTKQFKHRSLLKRSVRFYSGPLIFLIWLPAVVSGFWFEFGAESQVTEGWSNETAQVSQLEHWFRAQQTEDAVGLLTVVRVPLVAARSCPCLAGHAAAYQQLRLRWQHEAVRFIDPMAVPALPSGVDVMIFGADGHLSFAGPGLSSGTCGTEGSMLDSAIRAARHVSIYAGAADGAATGARLLRGACECATPVPSTANAGYGMS